MLEKFVPVDVPTCVYVHDVTAQLSIRYCVTPTLSVDAVQLRLICAPLAGIAVKPAGTVGVVVSAVVALATVELLLRFPAASVAFTR